MRIILLMNIFSLLFNKNLAGRIVGKMKHPSKKMFTPKPTFEITPEQCIINIKNKKFTCNDNSLYLKENNFITDKKLISISPGGFKGFYMLGTTSFIKENYDLNNYIFSGASAGAWNSLFMTFKGDPTEFVIEMLLDNKLNNSISIIDLEYAMKYKILNKYGDDDFDLERLFIGVTSFEKMKIKTNIFSDFDTLEDAINCCIASSHIPYITGTTFLNKYQNINTFDGGFSKYPYLNVIKPTLHINPSIWKPENSSHIQKTFIEKIMTVSTQVTDYTTLFSREKYDFSKLYDNGYNDAKKNKEVLDKIFV